VTAASSGTHTHAGARVQASRPCAHWRARLRDTEATGGGRGDTGGGLRDAARYRVQHAVLDEDRRPTKSEVDALGVVTISCGCLSAAAAIRKTPPYRSNRRFATLRNRRPTLLRAPAYRTPSEASSRRRCGHASRFLWKNLPYITPPG